MEKHLATILQYSEKKAIPIILYYIIIGIYLKASDSVDGYHTLILMGSGFLLTLIYLLTSYKNRGKDNTNITVSYMRSSMAKWKSQIRDMKLTNKYLEDTIRVFLYITINSIRKFTEADMKHLNFDDFSLHMSHVETNILNLCMNHNISMEIYNLLHDLNEKKIYNLGDGLSYLAITKNEYTEMEQAHMNILLVIQFTKSIIDTTIDAVENLEQEFDRIIQKIPDDKKYIIPMGEFDET